MEIMISIGILLIALLIIYKNIKVSSKGICNCGTCSKSCPINRKMKNK